MLGQCHNTGQITMAETQALYARPVSQQGQIAMAETQALYARPVSQHGTDYNGLDTGTVC